MVSDKDWTSRLNYLDPNYKVRQLHNIERQMRYMLKKHTQLTKEVKHEEKFHAKRRI